MIDRERERRELKKKKNTENWRKRCQRCGEGERIELPRARHRRVKVTNSSQRPVTHNAH